MRLLIVSVLAFAIHGAVAWDDDDGYHYPGTSDYVNRSSLWQDEQEYYHPYMYPDGGILPLGHDGWQDRPQYYGWAKGGVRNELWQKDLDDNWDTIVTPLPPGDGMTFPDPLLPSDDTNARMFYIMALKEVRIEEEKRYHIINETHGTTQLQFEWDRKMSDVGEYGLGLFCFAEPDICPDTHAGIIATYWLGRHPKYHAWQKRIAELGTALRNDMRREGLRILGRELLATMYATGQTYDLHVRPDPTETDEYYGTLQHP